MKLTALVINMLLPTLAAVYTLNYGRWAWQEQLHRGAVGLFLLAAITFAVPLLVLTLVVR